MADEPHYSDEEAKAILQMAAEAERSGERFAWEEVCDAANEVGIDGKHLGAARERFETTKRKRSLWLIGVSGLAAVSLGLLLQPLVTDRAQPDLLLHNELRDRPIRVSLLIPADESRECEDFWSLEAKDFCFWKDEVLGPRQHKRIGFPESVESCPFILMRFWSSSSPYVTVGASLPTGVEVERDWEIDQKGLGRSRLHWMPDLREVPPCW